MSSWQRQRGYIQWPSNGELAGCFAVVAMFFICVGIGAAVLMPKAWAWIKPVLQGWLA